MASDDSICEIIDTYTKIINALECPVCYEYVSPPIHQCNAGHIICGACVKASVNDCPTCRGKISTCSRAHTLEYVSEIMHFPCKNNECREFLSIKDLRVHEEQCPQKETKAEIVQKTDGKVQNPVSNKLFLHLKEFITKKANENLIHKEIQTIENKILLSKAARLSKKKKKVKDSEIDAKKYELKYRESNEENDVQNTEETNKPKTEPKYCLRKKNLPNAVEVQKSAPQKVESSSIDSEESGDEQEHNNLPSKFGSEMNFN